MAEQGIPPSVRRLAPKPEASLGGPSQDSSSPPSRDEPFMPNLPVELIERILSHLFLRSSPDTPSSDHYPLRNTSHVLLVSHAFRELALPFFLRAVTIMRSSDLATLFDAEDGFFVGPQGETRWKYVQEVSIVSTVQAPLRPSYVPDASFERPLAVPRFRRIKQLCILDPPHSPALGETDLDLALPTPVGLLIHHLQTNPSVQGSVLTSIEEALEKEIAARAGFDYESSTSLAHQLHTTGLEQVVKNRISNDAAAKLSQEHETFKLYWIASLSPCIVRERDGSDWVLGLERVRMNHLARTLPRLPALKVDRIVRYPDFDDDAGSETAEADLYRDLEEVAGLVRCKRVHLAEMERAEADRFIAWIKRRGVPKTKVKVQRWSWDGEDGKRCELDMSDLSVATTGSLDL